MKRFYFLHPVFFTIFPILFFFEKNKFELPLDILITPLVIFIGATLVLMLVLFFLYKNWHKAAILASFSIVLFFSFGHLVNLIPQFRLGTNAVGILLFIFLAYHLARTKKNLNEVTKMLAVVSLSLFLLQLINILRYLPSLKVQKPKILIENTDVQKKQLNLPDIYYIVPDRYASSLTLENEYKFDNSKFLNQLKKRGFYIVGKSLSNYPSTILSLASTLNLDYLDDLANSQGEKSANWNPAISLFQNNKVISRLKANGYAYVNLGSWWQVSKKNDNADFNFYYQTPAGTEFTARLLETTMYATIANQFLPETWTVNFRNEHKKAALFQFEKFKEIVDLKGPKFVFVHLLLPHQPYVFDEKCNVLSEEQLEKKELDNYLKQLQCLNTQLVEMIDKILTKNKKAIIILQSDEGPHPIKSPLKEENDWKNADQTALREKFRILNAFYLPDVDNSRLSPTLSPINTFRLVFNLYFKAGFELLPQKTFIFEDKHHIYKFQEITDEVKF